MKTNPIRTAVDNGEVQIGTWINMIRNSAILTLLKASGLDFARIDMEHSSPSMSTVADMAALARALDFPIMVRPPDGNREWITRLLDAGVYNLHCPQVDTPEQAAEIVRASRYNPIGSRGMIGASSGNDFESGGDDRARLAEINRNVFVTVMFESGGAFDHLDEIAAMDGIDCLTLGPTDLAQSLDVFGTPDMDKVLDERRMMILEAAAKHGKTTAMRVTSSAQARQWKDAGTLLLAYSAEVTVISEGYKRAVSEIRGD
jgi:2-keto-3-deoxy-L-rhamnonate aldolase RhmA